MAKAIKTTKEGKKMGLSNTMISWIYRSLFFLFTLLFLGVYNADQLHFMSVNSHLIFNEINLTFILKQTGGLLVLLGRILNQSFVIPIVGALLFGILLILIQFMLEKLYNVKGVFLGLTYILPAILLLYATSAGYALYATLDGDFAFVALLGTLISVSLFALYRYCSKKKWGGEIVGFAVIALVPFIGVYAVLSAAMIFLDSIINKQNRWHLYLLMFVLSLLFLLLGGRYIFCESYLTALFSPSIFSYFVILRVLFILIWIVLLLTPFVSYFLSKKQKQLTKQTLVLQSLTLIVVMSLVYAFSYKDENFRTEMKLVRLCDDGKWEEMEQVVAETDSLTKPINAYRVISLARQNKLSDNLFKFKFPLKASDGHYLSEEPIYYEDMFFHASLINSHYLFNLEMYMQIKPTNKRLKYMALYALMNGEDLLAERFLRQLKQSIIYHSWAEKHERYLGKQDLFLKENPDLAAIVKKQPMSVDLIRIEASLAEQFLMIGKFPIQTLEYRLLASLYLKQLKRFLGDIKRIKIPRLPVCMQEALIISVLELGENPAILRAYQVDRNVANQVNSFFHDLKMFCTNKTKEQAMGIMKKYKGTYCYYYMFY